MRLWVWGRSILLGWVTLAAIAYGVESPLLRWTGPLFGPVWIATAHLALDCLTLAAAGWVAGRLNRPHAIPTALLFALTLSFWDFGTLNVPWLLRLAWNTVHDFRFLEPLATSVETHVMLFGCLFAGALLSRPRTPPMSIASKFIRL
jgi:hypothetical protein